MDKSSGSSDSRDITLGCGSELGTPPITLNITTTTGGSFSVLVDVQNSVENLKKIIAKKLKVAKDRICLLHRERELQEGSLKENGLADGSKIILIPNVETGLLAQRPENTVMQALESLNDSQVNDFLSGKTPLNLSMRLGDHMMLIQLQLSTVNPSSPSHGGSRSRSSQRSSRSSSSSSSNTTTTIPANTTATTTTAAAAATTTNQTQTSTRKIDIDATNNSRHNNSTVNLDSSSRLSNSISVDGSSSSSSINSLHGGDLNSFLSKHDFENLQNIVKSLSIAQTTTACNNDEPRTLTCLPPPPPLIPQPDIALEQSPIKSLSNLVSSPIKTTSLKNIPVSNHFTAEASNSGTTTTADRTSTCSDPISAKLTSCLCKRLDSSKNCEINQCQSRHDTATTTTIYENNETPERVTATSTPVKQMPGLLHRTANNPFVRVKHRNHHSVSNNLLKKNTNSTEKLRTSTDNNSMPSTSSATDNATADPMCDVDEPIATISATDSRALAEASRNLTQTLRKLSKEVFTNKVDLTEETPRKSGSGAVIESMKNHGKGIYSGTFSGTLNPALQDRYGRPKRDISTVIHILNDLLSATPQYSRGARISFEAPTSRNSTKQSTTKHHTVTSTQDSCGKCHNSSKLNTCAYGECNGHYNSSTLGSTSVPSAETCQRNGDNSQIASCSCHDISSGTNSSFSDNSSADLNSSDNRSACTCSFRSHSGVAASSAAAASASSSSSSTTTATPLSYHTTTTTTNEDGNICNKCSIEIENNKTKCKLDQLRLVMQQRKQKREARKLKGAPYGARVVSTTSGSSSSAATASTIAPLTSPSEVSPNHMVEEVDTAA